MDAKSKANFINSVAGNQKKSCSVCNTLNEIDSLFCYSCGTKLSSQDNTVTSSITEKQETQQVNSSIQGEKKDEQVGVAAFASANNRISAREKKSQAKSESIQQIFQSVPAAATLEPVEVSVFAQGLPSWDVIPPQIMVRRKKK